MVDLEPLADEDWAIVRELVTRHVVFTEQRVCGGFSATLADQPFVKVMPRDYKRVLLAEAKARAENREPEFAELVGAV